VRSSPPLLLSPSRKLTPISLRSDKYIAHPRSDGGISHLHFHWEPLGDAARLETFLTSLDTPATHIFFNVALWLTRENPDPAVYVERMKPMLDTLVRVVPEAKVVARTSAGMNQAIVRSLLFLLLILSFSRADDSLFSLPLLLSSGLLRPLADPAPDPRTSQCCFPLVRPLFLLFLPFSANPSLLLQTPPHLLPLDHSPRRISHLQRPPRSDSRRTALAAVERDGERPTGRRSGWIRVDGRDLRRLEVAGLDDSD
jgi:hypothetical protein